MKRKSVSVLLTTAVSSAMLVTACSSSLADSNANSGNINQVELKLGYYSEPPTKVKMEELIATFRKKHPNINITTETGPHDQFYQKLNTEIAGGSAPDLWLSDGTKVFEFAERGAIKELNSFIEKDLKKDDLYGLEGNKGHDGKYWGVPQGVQVGVLYYNKDLFDKAGLKYPTDNWTWDDVKKASELLTVDANGKKSTDPGFDKTKVSQYGAVIFTNSLGVSRGWLPLVKSFGGSALDPTLQKAVLTSAEDKQAIEWMVDGMQRGLFPDPAALKSFQNGFKPFLSGIVGMQIDIYAARVAMKESGVNVDVVKMPKGPSGQRFAPMIVNSWVIGKNADEAKTKAAWEWIKYWATDDEVQKEWATLGEAIPVKKSVAREILTIDKSINAKVFLDSMEFAGNIDANAVFGEWRKAFADNMEPVFSGKLSVDEGVSKTNKAIQKILDGFYKK